MCSGGSACARARAAAMSTAARAHLMRMDGQETRTMAPQAKLLALLRQFLASNRPAIYAIAAVILIAYLFYRPPPPAGAGGQAACANDGRRGRTKARPRITLSTTHGVLFTGGPAALELAAGALEAMRKLAAYADVYLITPGVTADSQEAAVRDALASGGILDLAGFDSRKVLFCATALGRSAMCRQIEPSLHIDSAPDVVEQLAPHLPHVALISATPLSTGRENVLASGSLGELVELYLASVRFS